MVGMLSGERWGKFNWIFLTCSWFNFQFLSILLLIQAQFSNRFDFFVYFITQWYIQYHNSSPEASFYVKGKCYKRCDCDSWLAVKHLKFLCLYCREVYLLIWTWCWYSWDVCLQSTISPFSTLFFQLLCTWQCF